MTDCDIQLFDVHNQILNILGKISLPIKYGEDVLYQEFIVTNGITEDCILGLDAVFQHEFVLDGRNKTLFFSRNTHENLKALGNDDLTTLENDFHLAAVKKVIMIPMTTMVCKARIQENHLRMPLESTFIFLPSIYLPKGIFIDQFIDKINEEGIYDIRIENSSNTPISLSRGIRLGHIETACQIIGKIDIDNDHDNEQLFENKMESDLEPDVDEKYRQPIEQIVNDYKDLFASKDSELGSTGLIKHSIDTENKGPIRLRPYRTARRHKEETDRQINDMIKTNVIRPSTSPWAAPVVLVEKKNGEQRFCIDYRKLNQVTKKDSFPLPRIDDTLDTLHGKKFFTTLDLASGYWQIELEETSKEKTAFIVENNLYEFNRMAFGLCNAPATFQRLMNFILRDVLGKKALVYLDDVIIFSNTLEDHLADIHDVFQLIKKAGLKLKLKKCQFMKESVNYLGHVISSTGIAPDPSKIEKIANYKIPGSPDEVRSFLGLAGYYRRFIKDFGSIAKPLTRKTHKDVIKLPFTWTEEDQVSFEKLRTCLITPPILAYPDFDREFLLFTDACDYGIGAVLSQIQNDKEV